MAAAADTCCEAPPAAPAAEVAPPEGHIALLQAIEAGRAKDVKQLVEGKEVVLDVDVPAPAEPFAPPEVTREGLSLCVPGSISYISPLTWAVFHGRMPTLKYLIEQGCADSNGLSGDGRRPLHVAVAKGNAEIIQWLVELGGAHINATNFANETPLYHACYFAKEEAITYLLAHGADATIATEHGFVPLHMAASRGLPDAVETLLELYPDLINATSVDKTTPLHLAALCGRPEVVATLLKKGLGADLSLKDTQGRTALDLAATESSDAHASCAQMLVEAGALAQGTSTIAEAMLRTCATAGLAQMPLVVTLLKAGVNVDAPGSEGKTALHIAAFNGHGSIVRALVEAGADVNAEDEDGEPPSFYADMDGNDAMVRYLAQHGATYES